MAVINAEFHAVILLDKDLEEAHLEFFSKVTVNNPILVLSQEITVESRATWISRGAFECFLDTTPAEALIGHVKVHK
jgi:hypothetical protein